MRLLHTADWHLGQLFHRFSREQEHQAFLDWLLDLTIAEEIDALLVAGDIFDSGNPPAYAQKMLFTFLAELKGRHPAIDVVLIAGNHDSPGRMAALEPLLSALGISVVGEWKGDPSSAWIPLHDKNGDTAAWCAAIPFLRPADLPLVDKGDAYVEGMLQLHKSVMEAGESLRQNDQSLIAMGHLYLIGSAVSECSERRILGGHQHALPLDLFPESLDYVALGHMHKAQYVGDRETVRYSGSPLPLSINEADYPHQVVMFDLDDKSVRPVSVPRFKEVFRIPKSGSCSADELEDLFASLPNREETRENTTDAYLGIHVLLEEPDPLLRKRVEDALSSKAVQLCSLTVSYGGNNRALADQTNEALIQLDPETVFSRCYQHLHSSSPSEQLLTCFREILQAVEMEAVE